MKLRPTIKVMVAVVATTLTVPLFLAGCSESTEQRETREKKEVQVERDAIISDVHQIRHKLDDGRSVTCLIYNGYREASMTCDWGSAQ